MLVSDRELAVELGYKNNRGGWRAMRDFLKSRGVCPVDDRTPAMYDRDIVMRTYELHPPRKGNFATGDERKAQQTR